MKYKRKNKKINIIDKLNKWLVSTTDLMKNVLVFAIISGLLFNDPFGTIEMIVKLISGVNEKGLAGFISLAIIILMYRR